MSRLRSLFTLFITMFKIGLFTFGGGYAMIHLLDEELVKKKRWIDSDEFSDLVVIAESTPGPIAINCSTYIGYKKEKFLGAIASTLGICTPSFTIIYLISLFFDRFLEISWVNSAFRGIQMCVVFLILKAGINMLKKMKKTPFSITVTSLTLLSVLLCSLLAVSFSTIFYILIFGTLGLSIYAFKTVRKRGEGK